MRKYLEHVLNNRVQKGKQKSPWRATSRRRSQPLTPGREKVTQINVCIANKQTHDKHKDQLPLPSSFNRPTDTKVFNIINMWTGSSEFGTYRLCEQRRFRRACASAQSRQNHRCSLIQAVSQEEPSDRMPDHWPLWMAGDAQLTFVMAECSKTLIRLTGLMWFWQIFINDRGYHNIVQT